MFDRETVIKGLYHCAYDCSQNCPYYEADGCNTLLAMDVYSLLKEQEPHVLTLDEAVDGSQVYYVEFQYHMDRGWVKCDFSRMYLDGEVAMLFLRDKTFYQQKEDYGRLWRLWNARPTYDQMKKVKWND